MIINLERLSLKGKRKQRFFYYLYSYQHEFLVETSSKLGISASEIVRYLIENKLNEKEIKYFLASQ